MYSSTMAESGRAAWHTELSRHCTTIDIFAGPPDRNDRSQCSRCLTVSGRSVTVIATMSTAPAPWISISKIDLPSSHFFETFFYHVASHASASFQPSRQNPYHQRFTSQHIHRRPCLFATHCCVVHPKLYSHQFSGRLFTLTPTSSQDGRPFHRGGAGKGFQHPRRTACGSIGRCTSSNISVAVSY